MKEQINRFFGLADKQDIEEVLWLPVTAIVPNRFQPRTEFDEDKLDELCQSIKTHGIIQPIVVRPQGDSYELIAGERRWRATCRLGVEKIPALVKHLNDSQTASAALIENLQREGLTAIEEAVAYQQLMDLHGLTQESLAQRLGKGQSTIANKIRLLQLPEECHQALRQRAVTERHARALLPLKQAELQIKVLAEIIEKQFNVKQTEDRVEQLLHKEEKPKAKQIRRAYSRDMRLAMNTIRQSVDMILKTGMQVETDEKEADDYYEFIIKIPKK